MRTCASRTSRLKSAFGNAYLYGSAAAVYLVDRVTKVLAVRTLAGRPPVPLVPHVLDLRYTENSGGAFSLFGGRPWLFFGATLIVTAVIVGAASRVRSVLVATGLGLVLGGALGNLTDRILRGSGISGRVIDFIELHHWPVFNVADAAIVVGALLVIAAGARRRDDPAPGAVRPE